MIIPNLQTVRKHIPPIVELVCVSKFHSSGAIMEAYSAGERSFGESKVQELCSKREQLPTDIKWHFIGHLQTNKIKYIVPFVHLIHGVDSYKLLEEINKQATKVNRIVDCLLQVHIAQEETKFGFSSKELVEMLFVGEWSNLKHTRICGLMGMATFTDNEAQIRTEMQNLKQLFDSVKRDFFESDNAFSQLSMGMSDDYQIAIGEGSTIIRVGSRIFGERVYE